MNSSIEALNLGGGQFLHFAGAMLWQSSLLLAVVFILDWFLARKLRASVRYALWLAVLVKLMLPPTLALPTSPAWWLHPAQHTAPAPAIHHYSVSYDVPPLDFIPSTIPVPKSPPTQLMFTGWLLLAAVAMSMALLVWLAIRWWQVSRLVRDGHSREDVSAILEEAQRQAGFRSRVRLKIVDDRMSPALCGLFNPVILLPRTLTERLSPAQLRVVLLHELFHLNRHDMWVNFAQTLLQILYWWHPLLWFANARIRQVREQAVDDAVMVALNEAADDYAPTLLEVARMTFRRPIINLGLVGIMESRSALRHRIERLVNFSAPNEAGLTFASLCAVFVFSAVALPMGEAPDRAGQPSSLDASDKPLVAVTFALKDPANGTKLKQRLGKSGLQPPYFFFRNNGILFARGTPEQLDLIEQTIVELNGLHTNHLEGFAKETIEKQINDLADTNLYSRVFKVDSAPLLPILKDVFQENRDALLRVAPETTTLVDFPDRGTFIYMGREQLPPGARVIDKGTYTGPDRPAFDVAIHTLVKGMGLKMDTQGKSLFFAWEKNLLFVKGTPSDLDAIETMIQALASEPVQHMPATRPMEIPNQTNNLKGISGHWFPATEGKFGSAHLINSRVYKVDPAFVSRVLKQPVTDTRASREESGDSDNMVTEALQSLFKDQGLDLKAPGKRMIFNGSVDLLFVDATASDLKTIENSGVISRNDSPQLHIKARFYKVPERFFTGALDASLAAAITNGVGVLTAPEAKSLQQHLNSYHRLVGVETLAEPEVTTTSGRQTQMRATEVLCVITNFLFDENPTNLEASISPQTEQIETGPIFDVVPNLLVDGRTVNLFAIPSVTEFIGYADCTNLAPDSFTNSAGETGMLPVVLPAIKLSRETTTRNLFDGQSLVLFPKSEEVLFSKPNKERDERVAGHIRKWEKSMGDKRLMVVVTVDIVDSAGNRFYGDGDWAFSQDQIPTQPPN